MLRLTTHMAHHLAQQARGNREALRQLAQQFHASRCNLALLLIPIYEQSSEDAAQFIDELERVDGVINRHQEAK